MATVTRIVFFVMLLCYTTLALPVTQDMQVSDVGVRSEVVTKIEPVLSLDLQDVLVRVRRGIVLGNGCPTGKFRFKGLEKCISYEKYIQIVEGDYEDK